MARFSFWATYQRVWRMGQVLVRFLFSFISRWFNTIAGPVYSAVSWRNGRGSPNDREVNNENDLPRKSSPKKFDEGQHEAPTGSLQLPASEINDDGDEDSDDEEYRVDTTDELYCAYDSTWETEDHQQSTFGKTRRPAGFTDYKFRRFEIAAKDMQNYRRDYPYQVRLQRWNPDRSFFAVSSHDEKPNLGFYLGERPSVPDDMYIHDFHNEWYQNYNALESVHTYIQWLFPLQEPGVNSDASTLTKEEIKDFLENSTARANLLKSYKLMLDFYGIELCDENTGEVERATNWRKRFNNLNSHTHNSLRITRILKCLGTLGYAHYQYPLVLFFLNETLNREELSHVKDSVLNYFVFAVLDKKQRRRLIKFAYLNYEPKDEFVWCPKKIQMIWSRRYPSKPEKGFNVKQYANSQH